MSEHSLFVGLDNPVTPSPERPVSCYYLFVVFNDYA
jgi:hypothetical protein